MLRYLSFVLAALVLPLLTGTPLAAADFAFSVIIRAGIAGPGDWELGIGAPGLPAGSIQTAHMRPYYGNNTPQRFEIAYNEASRTASVRVYHSGGGYAQASYTLPDAFTLPARSTWTLPGSSFYVTAHRRPEETAIRLDSLALGPGLSVLEPLASTSLAAAPPRTGPTPTTTPMGSPVVFRAYGNGGDWVLSGNIAMQGLGAYTSPAGQGAQRSQLHFGLTAEADAGAVPEPAHWPVFALLAAAVAGRAAWRRRKAEGSR